MHCNSELLKTRDAEAASQFLLEAIPPTNVEASEPADRFSIHAKWPLARSLALS